MPLSHIEGISSFQHTMQLLRVSEAGGGSGHTD